MNYRPQYECEQLIVLISSFQNSATKHSQMAAPNRMLFCESCHATQTRVLLMYVTVHTYIHTYTHTYIHTYI